MHRGSFRLLVLAAIFLILAASGASAQEDSSQAAAQADAGPHLEWIQFSVGGVPAKVNAGGVLAMHPDTPFRVIDAASDSWLDYGLKYLIKDMPGVDLEKFHTLSNLLGEDVYRRKQVPVFVLKDGKTLGEVQLLVKLLPIDWLRRAQDAPNLADKIKYTQKALELTPDDALLNNRLVDLLTEARRYQEAVDILKETSAGSESSQVLSKLADLYRRLDQPDKEAAALSKLLADDPGNPELVERLAVLYQELQRWEEAAQLLQRLVDLKEGPEKALVFRQLAMVLTQAGMKEQARQAWEQAARLTPGDPQLWLALADSQKELGDTAGEIDALQRAFALTPNNLALAQRLGEALLAAERKKEAAQVLEKAAELDPKDATVLARLSRLYEGMEDRAALIKSYERLARLNPEDANLQFNLAVLNLEMDKAEDALGYLEAAARLKPDDKEISLLTLEALSRLGRWDQVLELCAKLLEKNPNDLVSLDPTLSDLAEQKPKGWTKLLDQIIKTKPNDAKYYEMRAVLALEAEDTKGAISALEMGVKALPDNLDMQSKLAKLYEADGQNQKALDAWGRVLDLKPDFPGAQDRYLQLKTYLMSTKPKAGASADDEQ